MPETDSLIAFLSTIAEGQVVTHMDALTAAGMKKGEEKHLRTILNTARRSLIKEGIVFGALHGIGIKRLKPDEIVDLGGAMVGRVRRATTRAVKTVTCADTKRLSGEKLSTFNLRMTQLKLMEHAGKRETEGKLAQACITKQIAFSAKEALQFLA